MIVTKDNFTEHHLINDNCFNVSMKDYLKEGKGFMVLTDLPYGTTNAKWDSVLNLEDMWKWLNNFTKDTTPILLFSQTPFDKVLGVSNIKQLKYEWVWEKGNATGHLNAKKMPMKSHENILTFYKKLPLYNPQKTTGHILKESRGNKGSSELYGEVKNIKSYASTDRYPRDILKFSSDKQKLNIHSTQKPLDLLRYLIRTYTNEDDTVIDFTAGSMSTSVAAYLENRNSICIEKDTIQYEKSAKWVKGCSKDNPYNML